MIIAVKKEKSKNRYEVEIKVHNTVGDVKTFKLPQHKLPLDQSDRKVAVDTSASGNLCICT
ncbi:MAG: hypothetical protein QXJ97_09645 [Desulfurococcaceae archaeon]